MTEDPAFYQQSAQLSHSDAVDLTPAMSLVALMLASRKLARFRGNKTPQIICASLVIESGSYLRDYSPEQMSQFDQQVSDILK